MSVDVGFGSVDRQARTVSELDGEDLVDTDCQLLDGREVGYLRGRVQRVGLRLAQAQLTQLAATPRVHVARGRERHRELVAAADLLDALVRTKGGDVHRDIHAVLLGRFAALHTELAELVVAHSKQASVLKKYKRVLAAARDELDRIVLECLKIKQ